MVKFVRSPVDHKKLSNNSGDFTYSFSPTHKVSLLGIMGANELYTESTTETMYTVSETEQFYCQLF